LIWLVVGAEEDMEEKLMTNGAVHMASGAILLILHLLMASALHQTSDF